MTWGKRGIGAGRGDDGADPAVAEQDDGARG